MEHREEAIFGTEEVDLPVHSRDVEDVVLGALCGHCSAHSRQMVARTMQARGSSRARDMCAYLIKVIVQVGSALCRMLGNDHHGPQGLGKPCGGDATRMVFD